MKIFPKSEWIPLNKIIGGFGQIVCKAKKPACDRCPINQQCQAHENFMKKKLKKVQVSEDDLEDMISEKCEGSREEIKKVNQGSKKGYAIIEDYKKKKRKKIKIIIDKNK